jgi:transcriptional regulator with XRE-family HTH domain
MLRLDQLNEGPRTRVLRVALGLTQRDLAALANVDRRRLSEFERDQQNALRPEAVARLQAVLAMEGGDARAMLPAPASHRRQPRWVQLPLFDDAGDAREAGQP